MVTGATAAARRTAAGSARGPAGDGASVGTSPKDRNPGTSAASKAAGAAAVVDLSAAAKRQIAQTLTGTAGSTSPIGETARSIVRSFDEIVRDRTQDLAGKLADRLTRMGIPQDEPIVFRIDSLGQVKTDSPYRERIEKMFRDDPELAKDFQDVASLNAMKAAQTALEALDAEKKAAKDDDARDAAYGLYTARLMTSQALSETMTLRDGALISASVDFMDVSVRDSRAGQASRKPEPAATKRVSLTV